MMQEGWKFPGDVGSLGQLQNREILSVSQKPRFLLRDQRLMKLLLPQDDYSSVYLNYSSRWNYSKYLCLTFLHQQFLNLLYFYDRKLSLSGKKEHFENKSQTKVMTLKRSFKTFLVGFKHQTSSSLITRYVLVKPVTSGNGKSGAAL